MGDVFPELRVKKEQIKSVLKIEEEAFNRTLDRGMALFEEEIASMSARSMKSVESAFAFQLYDTYGFPLDLTELLARERGLTVDTDGFEKLMEEQRARARAAMKKNVVSVSEIETKAPTKFIGYDNLEADVKVLEVVEMKDKTAVVLDVYHAIQHALAK